jgi:hypothetical protein
MVFSNSVDPFSRLPELIQNQSSQTLGGQVGRICRMSNALDDSKVNGMLKSGRVLLSLYCLRLGSSSI